MPECKQQNEQQHTHQRVISAPRQEKVQPKQLVLHHGNVGVTLFFLSLDTLDANLGLSLHSATNFINR